jgi:hypothetical protein
MPYNFLITNLLKSVLFFRLRKIYKKQKRYGKNRIGKNAENTETDA